LPIKLCCKVKIKKIYYLQVNNLDNNVDKSLPNIILYLIFNVNVSRAISITRTIFRLNTNKSHAYEDYKIKKLLLFK